MAEARSWKVRFIVTNKDFCTKLAQRGNVISVSKVTASNFVPHAQKDSRNAAHAGTANTDKVHGAEVGRYRLTEIWFDHKFPNIPLED